MHRRDFLRSSTTLAAVGVLGYSPDTRQAASATSGDDAPFIAIRDRYFLRQLQLNPVTSTYLGGDGYDPSLRDANGRLRDYSPNALSAELSFYKEIRRAVAAIDPATLSESARIDYHLMDAQIGFVLHETGERQYYQRAVDSYVQEPFRGVDWQLQQMTPVDNTPMLGTEDEWSFVTARVAAIPAYLAVAQANLVAGKAAGNIPDRRMVDLDGITAARANADYFRKTLVELANGYTGNRPFARATVDRLAKAGETAAVTWEGFAKFLGETFDIHETTDRFATGEAEYAWRIKNVLHDPRTPAELYEYGAQQVAMYTERMVAVARQVGEAAGLKLAFGTPAEQSASVRKVMDHLSADAPKNDDELFRWYRDTGVRAVAYGREQQLFDIPVDYRLDVVETPPVLRSSIDAAYYPAPPFKKTGVGRFYLTPTGNDVAVLKTLNRASVADTAIHEGFPGHDWHYKYMTQHATEISNIRWLTPGAVEDSSSMWSDSMAAEGWGLYAEELMSVPAPGHPYGFYDAGENLYQLQGQQLRAVRVRVDVGIHTGRMTFDDAVDYYTANVNFYPGARLAADRDPAARASRDEAVKAIYRYSKWPTQAITYNLGKNAIVSLREAVKQKQGGAFSARTFHERLMRMGTIPASYFRDAFIG